MLFFAGQCQVVCGHSERRIQRSYTITVFLSSSKIASKWVQCCYNTMLLTWLSTYVLKVAAGVFSALDIGKEHSRKKYKLKKNRTEIFYLTSPVPKKILMHRLYPMSLKIPSKFVSVVAIQKLENYPVSLFPHKVVHEVFFCPFLNN